MQDMGDSTDQAAERLPSDEGDLDPVDWTRYRELAHEVFGQSLDFVQDVRERPVWREPTEDVVRAFSKPLPVTGVGPHAATREILEQVYPFANGNLHPRFFGWVHGAGTVGGVLASTMEAALNSNLAGRNHAPVLVERQVIEWCRQIFGLPPDSSGVLVSGTSMASLVGIAVARHSAIGPQLRRKGLQASDRTLVGYTSAEAHSCNTKAFELLGLGGDNLRSIPVDEDFRMRIDHLEAAIEEDLRAGRKPFLVIGTAGTVNTGAFDDLDALASISQDRGMWFHVDGAFGAAAMLSDRLKDKLGGIERADSIAFDFHKWFQVPYDAGCVLVRDGAAHLAAFAKEEDYMAEGPALAGGAPWFTHFGPEMSRGFRGLKIWFTLMEHGTSGIAEAIEGNRALALYLAARVREEASLELMAPVPLNIVCFRFVEPGLPDTVADRINTEIVARLQQEGIAAPSTTRLRGRVAIRACIANHRSKVEDIEILTKNALALGRELARE
mgnify:FL=1